MHEILQLYYERYSFLCLYVKIERIHRIVHITQTTQQEQTSRKFNVQTNISDKAYSIPADIH